MLDLGLYTMCSIGSMAKPLVDLSNLLFYFFLIALPRLLLLNLVCGWFAQSAWLSADVALFLVSLLTIFKVERSLWENAHAI